MGCKRKGEMSSQPSCQVCGTQPADASAPISEKTDSVPEHSWLSRLSPSGGQRGPASHRDMLGLGGSSVRKSLEKWLAHPTMRQPLLFRVWGTC